MDVKCARSLGCEDPSQSACAEAIKPRHLRLQLQWSMNKKGQQCDGPERISLCGSLLQIHLEDENTARAPATSGKLPRTYMQSFFSWSVGEPYYIHPARIISPFVDKHVIEHNIWVWSSELTRTKRSTNLEFCTSDWP